MQIGFICLGYVGQYSQHFVFFVTYEWAQYERLLKVRLERLARYKHSILFGTFVSYKEKNCVEYDSDAAEKVKADYNF
jgi:hypothetical protein